MVRQLERDLPELMSCFNFPRSLWRKLLYYQYHRALFCGGAPPNAPHGLLCQLGRVRSNHLLDLPPLQPGMEKLVPSGFLHKELDLTFLSRIAALPKER
jgi:hypothetical protein